MKPIIICDTREQDPLVFSDAVIVESRALHVGDYSIAGLETDVVIERKSLSDLLGSITSGRERFEKELRQLRGYRFAAILIESNWPTILSGIWDCPSSVSPNVVLGSLMGFARSYGVIPIMADDHATAGLLCERLLILWAKLIERDFKNMQAAAEIGAAQ